MNSSDLTEFYLTNIDQLRIAVDLFNVQKWYPAHDAFEEIWHNTNGSERVIIQSILHIAVAEVHLSNNNKIGATMLYGESLGRLKNKTIPNIGLDIKRFIIIIESRLKALQNNLELIDLPLPKLAWLKKNDLF